MKKVAAIICILIVGMLTGCGAVVPNLTQQQQELITEYAANLLLKYNNVETKSLLNEEQLAKAEEEQQKELEKAMKKKEAQEAYLKAQANANASSANDTADKSQTNGSKQDNSDRISDLSSFLGLDGFQIQYAGSTICSSYPEQSRDDYFMAIDATGGKQLCVAKLNVTNISSEEREFDMFEKKANFYTIINGGEKVPAQSTLLLDDFAVYKGTMAAGQSEDMVLIFEVPESVGQVDSMELVVRYASARGVLTLQ